MMKRLLNWGKQLLLLLLLGLIISIGLDWWRGSDFPKTAIPPLTAKTLQGDSVDLAELSKEQAVLVYFWANWCSVCNFVSPSVEELAEYYPVVTVALSSGDDLGVKKYLQHHGYSFNVINDDNYALGQAWQVKVTPTIFIIKNGEVKWFTTGFTSLPGLWWRMLLA